MHFSVLAVSAAIAGIVSAQSTGGLPSCADDCVNNLLPTSCNGDPSCICADTNFISNISCCIYNACQPSDQQAALDFAKTYCTPVGVTLPQSAGCSSSSTSGTASSTATSAPSSAEASASSALSSVSSSASSVSRSASAAAATSSSSAGEGQKFAAQGLGLVGAVVGAVALL